MFVILFECNCDAKNPKQGKRRKTRSWANCNMLPCKNLPSGRRQSTKSK